ncbi:MAG: hypothetical protein GC179_24355 [Anaerolineaceae bacterium]|nr:hypothetical protein [Anaerolineaceae bacterium]
MSHKTGEAPRPEYVLEENKSFSQSLIWKLQRQYYIDQGVDAWSKLYIPFGITTNPVIAMAYSRVIYGYIRDWLAQIDISEPVYIVEIGAGSGRLGYNILNQLEEFYSSSAVKHVPYQYVLTDLAKKNVEFWKTHPQLEPYVEAGKVDFARFDLANDTELTLEHSGKKLVSGTLKNPVIVIANYTWDTLPADLFYVEDGQLFEVQTSLVTEQPETNLSDPELIKRIDVVYDRFPTTTDFYHDPQMRALLEMYRQQLQDSMLIFPYNALQCIHRLQQLSNNRMMLLTADKGDHRIEDLVSSDIPQMALHDNGFSIQFNYHAITKFFEHQHGTVLTTTHSFNSINILVCLLGDSEFAETRHSYHDYIERINPADFYTVLMEFPNQSAMTLENLLAYVRLKSYDSHAFIVVYNKLLTLIAEQYTVANAYNLQLVLRGVWDNYYHLGEQYNLPVKIATILQKVKDYKSALGFYMYAIQLYGTSTHIRMSMVICHMGLGNRQMALDLISPLAIELPENEDVKIIKEQIEAMPEPPQNAN